MKTFAVYNFGCRVNAAETNQFAQSLIDNNFVPLPQEGSKGVSPDLIFINTCSITKKANIESLGLIRRLQKNHPTAKIIVSGCANLKNLTNLDNISLLTNQQKEDKLIDLNCAYTHKIKDKFSHTDRFLLKVQSGCTAFCSYCTVPNKRPYLYSLSIKNAIDTTKKTVKDGYKEVIITGVNLNQYTPGFSNLIGELLEKTDISLISFGSIPVLCIDHQFIDLLKKYPTRLSRFLHIPLQSGSDKILKLMNRSYNKKNILEKFNLLKKIKDLSFGTDIIVAFPGETDIDFQKTYDLCKEIEFSKIHVFRYSPRPNTSARKLFLESKKISQNIAKSRSQKLRSLISQTTLPSRQKQEN
ncbi:MiaB/RimO family radical SAM methylthiotransferase [Patescibacteria group bacterium]|nr:MiaB/RimO family radical SAM methylthiotransferase [Patescibacteria group bacterium]